MSVDGGRRVLVGATSRGLTAYGGAELLRATMRVVGVMRAVDDHVRLEQRARGLSEAELVAAMVEAIALGGRCLDDLSVARADAAQATLPGFGVPPAPQTAGTWLRPLFEHLETAGVTYLCGVPLSPKISRLRDGRRFRRYVVKRIPVAVGEQTSRETGG